MNLVTGAITGTVGQLDDQDTTRIVAFHQTQDPISETDGTPALGKTSIGMGISSAARGVRRLTPRECERLQGVPDDWTRITPDTPDSRRYAAMGDAVTVPVARWLGERLARYAA